MFNPLKDLTEKQLRYLGNVLQHFPDAEFKDKAKAALADAGRTPTPAELADAPLLDKWVLMRDWVDVTVLCGWVTAHPLLSRNDQDAKGKSIATSPVVAIDVDAGYARTVSRWYRLGTPLEASPEDPSVEHFQKVFDRSSGGYGAYATTQIAAAVSAQREMMASALSA